MGDIYLNGIRYGGLSGPPEGDQVYVNPIINQGIKIAEITVNDTVSFLYSPGGVSNVKVDGVTVVNQQGIANIDLTGKQDNLIAGNNITIDSTTNTISAIDTTYSPFIGASEVAGSAGLVPVPYITDKNSFLKGDGTWATVQATSSISTLTDVNLTNLSDGQILKYDATNQKWINATGGSGGTGNVNDVYVNGESVLDINSIAQIKSYKEVTQAEYDALPASKESDGILYAITDGQGGGGGGGGTTVIPNPSGDATDELEKVQIDNVIYKIGGGGSSEDDKTINYLGSTLAQWIALPLYSDDNPVIKTKLFVNNISGEQAIIGDLWALESFMLYIEQNQIAFRYTTNNVDLIPAKLYKWVDVELDYSTGTLKYDGVTYGGIQKTQLHNQVCLFGLPNYERRSMCAMSDIQIYKNGNIYMNLVPMVDSTTGDGYYYDTIGQQSYYSSGSPMVYGSMNISSKEDILELIYEDGTAGTDTFTIPTNGKYMIINAWSWQGGNDINKGVTTLPSGRTAIIDEEIINASTFGYRLTVADLQGGDVITMTNYDGGWTANTKLIFKISNFNPTSVIHQATTGDNWIDVSNVQGSGGALFIGICLCRNIDTLQDTTIEYIRTKYKYKLIGYANTNVRIRIAYCDIADMPRFRMYGYDGGFAGLAVIQ